MHPSSPGGRIVRPPGAARDGRRHLDARARRRALRRRGQRAAHRRGLRLADPPRRPPPTFGRHDDRSQRHLRRIRGILPATGRSRCRRPSRPVQTVGRRGRRARAPDRQCHLWLFTRDSRPRSLDDDSDEPDSPYPASGPAAHPGRAFAAAADRHDGDPVKPGLALDSAARARAGLPRETRRRPGPGARRRYGPVTQPPSSACSEAANGRGTAASKLPVLETISK